MANIIGKIGIALSGGGIRSIAFHLGVLKWMAENELMGKIDQISSVSGASLCIGLVMTLNNNKWPTDKEFLDEILPKMKKTILTNNIQHAAMLKLIFSPHKWGWGARSNVLSTVINKKYGINSMLSQLPDIPKWHINCTTFETGKGFKISKESMGDYRIGTTQNPKLKLADAIASSTGFPSFGGAFKLKLSDYQWVSDRKNANIQQHVYKDLHICDGSVYDNLSLESLYRTGVGLQSCIDYLIISNASGTFGQNNGKVNRANISIKRLLDISMNQVGALRNRDVVSYIKNSKNGIYINIGNTAAKIVRDSRIEKSIGEKIVSECLTKTQAAEAKEYNKSYEKPTEQKFELILRHGYELANCTYVCYIKENL